MSFEYSALESLEHSKGRMNFECSAAMSFEHSKGRMNFGHSEDCDHLTTPLRQSPTGFHRCGRMDRCSDRPEYGCCRLRSRFDPADKYWSANIARRTNPSSTDF